MRRLASPVFQPAMKKSMRVVELRDFKDKAAALRKASQVLLDELCARRHDAWAETEGKMQSPDMERQSAWEVFRQAEKRYNLYHKELRMAEGVDERFMSAMEEDICKQDAEAEAEIQRRNDEIDQLDQQIRALEASSTGDSS